MNLQPKELKNEAALRLSNAPGNHKKIMLVYGAVALGASVLCQLLYLVTNLAMANMSGLASMGTRTILQSIQVFLPSLVTMLLPFWSLGLMQTVLRMVRQERVAPGDLLGGFARFFVVVRLYFFMIVIYTVLTMVAFQVAAFAITFTPYADNMFAILEPYAQDVALLEQAMADPAVMGQLAKAMIPMFALSGVLMLALLLPATYGMRLSFYRVLDEDRPGALRSISESRRMMKGNKWHLFKLDLSFWWYYLLMIVVSLIVDIPQLLPTSLQGDVADLVATLVHAVVCLWLYVKFLLRFQAAQAVFYDTLHEAHKAPPVQPVYWQYPQQ